jgi:hypothetical protein
MLHNDTKSGVDVMYHKIKFEDAGFCRISDTCTFTVTILGPKGLVSNGYEVE